MGVAGQRSRRHLDASPQVATMMTLSHEINNNEAEEEQLYRRRRHFYDQLQRSQLAAARVPPMVPMVPMMIDDDDDDDDDEEDIDHLGFCQFDAAHGTQVDTLDADDLDQHRQLQYQQQRQRSHLIDGHPQQQRPELAWRQRQAQNLTRELQQYHLQQNSNETAELESLADLSSIENNQLLYHQSQNAPSAAATQRTYANTKRMLITASKLNNQQLLYKQNPFDYSQADSPAYSHDRTSRAQVYYQAHKFHSSSNNECEFQNQEQEPDEHFQQVPLPLVTPKAVDLSRTSAGGPQRGAAAAAVAEANAMQASGSKQQLAPAEHHHTSRTPAHSSPYHQQVKRSKSAQQHQQQMAPSGNKFQQSNFQLQQAAPTRQVMLPKSPSSTSNLAAQQQQRRTPDSTPVRPSNNFALSCCGKVAKLLLFLTNAMFWSAGVALGAWGILALVDDHKYNLSQLLIFDQGTRMSLFQLLSWSFITLGCATILVGFCGCSAMFKNNRWILGLYIFLILAIFALDLATGLLAVIFQERLVASVRLRLAHKLKSEYGIQASFTAAIDYIQTRYECCGLEGHFDYDQSLWRLQRLGGFEATVARTCCHLRNTFDDQAHVNPRPVNESMCQSTDVRFHQSYRHRRDQNAADKQPQGCLDDLERLIRSKIWTFTTGCGAVGAVILLSLLFATCFCRSIPASNGSRKNSPAARAQTTQQQIASLSYLVDSANNGNQMIGHSKKQGHAVPDYR